MRLLPAIIIASFTATSAFAAGALNISPMPVDLGAMSTKERTVTGTDKATSAFAAPKKADKKLDRKARKDKSPK